MKFQPFNGVLHAFKYSDPTRLQKISHIIGTKCGHKFRAYMTGPLLEIDYDLPICEECKRMNILEELAE